MSSAAAAANDPVSSTSAPAVTEKKSKSKKAAATAAAATNSTTNAKIAALAAKGTISKGKQKKTAAAATPGVQKAGRSNRFGMTDQALRRVAQRGGLIRAHPGVYAASVHFSQRFLKAAIRRVLFHTQHEHFKSITSEHALKGLSELGVKLCGYSL